MFWCHVITTNHDLKTFFQRIFPKYHCIHNNSKVESKFQRQHWCKCNNNMNSKNKKYLTLEKDLDCKGIKVHCIHHIHPPLCPSWSQQSLVFHFSSFSHFHLIISFWGKCTIPSSNYWFYQKMTDTFQQTTCSADNPQDCTKFNKKSFRKGGWKASPEAHLQKLHLKLLQTKMQALTLMSPPHFDQQLALPYHPHLIQHWLHYLLSF